MANGLWERLRGARRIEIFAALALAALIALVMINAGSAGHEQQKTELEARLERILSNIDGAGRVSAMITQDASGTVDGVLIVTDGARDVGTYIRVQSAVQTLLKVELEQIEIIGGTGGL